MFIEVKNLSHTYNKGLSFEQAALKDISFTIEAGEFVALIGHTGSGKSTLIQHLNGLLKPESGEVLADGVSISAKTAEALALRRRTGLVFQYPEYQLFEETVMADVCFGPANLGLSKEECEDRARKALELVGINPDEKAGKSPFSLSGGGKRRVAIAGVLAMEPELLILDEPTAGLDPVGHDEILAMLERIRRERDITVVLVSHNMEDVAKLATRVLVMERGELVMNGTPAEVFARDEELAAMGLAVPAAKKLLASLKRRGININSDILGTDEAAAEILRVFG